MSPSIVIIVPPPVHPNPCDYPGCVTYGEAYPWLYLFPFFIIVGMVIWGVWAVISWLVDRLWDFGQRHNRYGSRR